MLYKASLAKYYTTKICRDIFQAVAARKTIFEHTSPYTGQEPIKKSKL
jgi:hypothetical protein